MNNLVILENNQALTTSLKISEVFDKEHRNVLKDIDRIIENTGGAQNVADLFYETEYQHPQNKQTYRQYLINRDGFTLLAMGFTGRKALEFKLKYIEAFNQMEKQLKMQAPTTMVEALEMALIAAKEKEALQIELETKNQVIGELKPKADYTDLILKSKSLVTITQIAKDYGMSGAAMNNLLHELGVQYKQSGQWLLYQKHHAKGYTHSETFVIEQSNGITRTSMNTKWTQKGRLFLYELLKENDVLPLIEKEE